MTESPALPAAPAVADPFLSRLKGLWEDVRVIGAGLLCVVVVHATLFQPFTSTKGKGMGLGLSICRTIVEGHGGKLWVESGDNGGTIFKFTLMQASREFEDDS